MIVKENINFERGQNPKSAMDIGVVTKIQKYIIALKKESEMVIKELNADAEDGEYELFAGNDYEDDESYITSTAIINMADQLLEIINKS